jgi:hypothetical protein
VAFNTEHIGSNAKRFMEQKEVKRIVGIRLGFGSLNMGRNGKALTVT